MNQAIHKAPPVPDPPVLHVGDEIFCVARPPLRVIVPARVLRLPEATLFGRWVLVEDLYDKTMRWYVPHVACDTRLADLYYRLRTLK